MIEISFGKLVLLALIALIVLGPEKLPGAARTAGALLRRVRGGWNNVRAEVERELEIEEIRRAAREAAAHAEKAQAELNATVRKVDQASASLAATSETSFAPAPTTAPALEHDAAASDSVDTLPEDSAPVEEPAQEAASGPVPYRDGPIQRRPLPRAQASSTESPHGGA